MNRLHYEPCVHHPRREMRRWEYRTQMFVFEIFSTMLDMRNWLFELMHREQLEHFDDLAAVSIAAARQCPL